MNRILIPGIAGLVILLIIAAGSLFTVSQTEQVLVVQFGEVVRPIDQPGLHAKLPIIQNVIDFDRRLMAVELPGEEVILGDQRRLIVDAVTVFRISDPLRFYQAIGPVPENIRGRLNSVVTGSLRRVMGNHKLLDVLSADRERIMSAIRGQVNTEMQNFGVSIADVRIRRADLPRRTRRRSCRGCSRSGSALPRRPAPRAPKPPSASARMPSGTAPCCWPTPAPRPTTCAARARPRRPASTPNLLARTLDFSRSGVPCRDIVISLLPVQPDSW